MESQLFIKHMTELGYKPFMPGNVILGFCLDEGKLYIGYDESQDKPYFIGSKENYKVLYRSFSGQSVCNMLLRLEIPYQDSRLEHFESIFDLDYYVCFELKHNKELSIAVSTTDICVSSGRELLATFQGVSYDYIVEFVLMLGGMQKLG
jgi:hypothetical protein